MKQAFLLLLIITVTHSVNIDMGDELLKLILTKQENTKLKLLSQFTALDWGYNGTQKSRAHEVQNTPQEHLEVLARGIMRYHPNLTLKQKVNVLKIKYIVDSLEQAIMRQEHIQRAKALDNLASSKGGNLSSIEQERYQSEEKLSSVLVMHEGQLAMDLLIQSFAPPNLEVTPELYDNSSDIEIEQYAERIKRNVGAVNLVNVLLDPPYRIAADLKDVAKVGTRRIIYEVNRHAAANYNFTELIDDYDYGGSSSTEPAKVVNVTNNTSKIKIKSSQVEKPPVIVDIKTTKTKYKAKLVTASPIPLTQISKDQSKVSELNQQATIVGY